MDSQATFEKMLTGALRGALIGAIVIGAGGGLLSFWLPMLAAGPANGHFGVFLGGAIVGLTAGGGTGWLAGFVGRHAVADDNHGRQENMPAQTDRIRELVQPGLYGTPVER